MPQSRQHISDTGYRKYLRWLFPAYLMRLFGCRAAEQAALPQELTTSEDPHAQPGEPNVTAKASSDERTCGNLPPMSAPSASGGSTGSNCEHTGWEIFERDVERPFDAQLEHVAWLLDRVEEQELNKLGG